MYQGWEIPVHIPSPQQAIELRFLSSQVSTLTIELKGWHCFLLLALVFGIRHTLGMPTRSGPANMTGEAPPICLRIALGLRQEIGVQIPRMREQCTCPEAET